MWNFAVYGKIMRAADCELVVGKFRRNFRQVQNGSEGKSTRVADRPREPELVKAGAGRTGEHGSGAAGSRASWALGSDGRARNSAEV